MGHHRDDRPRPEHRETAKWAAGLAAFMSLAAALFSLQLNQLSGETSAKATLERAIDALAEGDASIVRQYDALQASAEASGPGDMIALDDYPVPVTFTRAEVIDSTPEQLTEIALARATERVYAEGADILRDDEATAGPGRFSAAGGVDAFLGLLTEHTNTVTTWLTLALVGLSTTLILALASLCHGFGRVGGPGLALAAAAAVLLLAGGAAWLSATASGDAEYLTAELLAIGKDLAGLPLRNGAALGVLGLVLIACGAAGDWLDTAFQQRERGVS
jgi:hypothetical protein